MITLSVVIDTYNYGRFIVEAIGSVLAQDSRPDEVIIVDDGSTDDTEERVRPFLGEVAYVRKPNGGQASTLNEGIRRANGDVISFLDADDIWAPEKLSAVRAAFEEHSDVLMVQHFQRDIDASAKSLGSLPLLSTRKPTFDLDDIRRGTATFSGTSALSFRKSFLVALGPIPPTLIYCPDEYLYTFTHFFGLSRNIPRILSARRLHGSNPSSYPERDPKKLRIFIGVRRFIDHALIDEFKKRKIPGLDQSEERRRAFEIHKLECLEARYTADWKTLRDVFRGHWRDFDVSPRWFYQFIQLALVFISPSLYHRLRAKLIAPLYRARQGEL